MNSTWELCKTGTVKSTYRDPCSQDVPNFKYDDLCYCYVQEASQYKKPLNRCGVNAKTSPQNAGESNLEILDC